eukprot:s82_g18.t1
MRCAPEQVRSAVADLYLLKEQISPKDALLRARAYPAEVPNETAEEKAKKCLVLAEAKLLAFGPGEMFKAALDEAESASVQDVTQAEGSKVKIQLLQLKALTAVMRRQLSGALHFAKESRMLADALVLGPSGPEPDNLECLAQAHCLTSVSYRLSGDFEDSTEAARKLVQLGKEHGQSELEACGEILVASAALARAEPALISTQISMKLQHVQLLQRGSALQQAAASAERAWQLSGSWSSRTSLQISLRGTALLRLCQALALQGRDAAALARRELGSSRAARCWALEVAAITALAAAQLPRVEEALARLRTLGREAEGARMEVAFMAAKYWKSMGKGFDRDETDLELETWDKATAYLQQALSLARARQDFISEVAALQLLTELHLKIGLQPPRSNLRSSVSAQLSAAAAESNRLQQLLPLLEALQAMDDAGYQVDELLAPADIREAMSAIESKADWWETALAEAKVPSVLISFTGAKNGDIKGPRLSMVEVTREQLYRDVRVAGVQYGPRYRQVQGFIPAGKSLTSSKPAVVGWEARSWDWAPPLVDAAAHSAFLFGQKSGRVVTWDRAEISLSILWLLTMEMRVAYSPTERPRQRAPPWTSCTAPPAWRAKLARARAETRPAAKVVAGCLVMLWKHRSSKRSRCRGSWEKRYICRAHHLEMEYMDYSPLPAAENSWALVTGAATGLGWKLARACANAGYGLILTDQAASLQGLEDSYKTLGVSADRILQMPMNLADPSGGVALLHSQIKEEGLDVCILFVCSDQYSYTGNFLEQKVDNLDKMLALNVGATTVLCRLFGEDMLKAGRGRILLIGAPQGASLGVAGASAFAGSMAFIRTLANGLRKEFADTGVGISCMETSSLGRDGSLLEALENTCVGFLVKEEVDAATQPLAALMKRKAKPATTPVEGQRRRVVEESNTSKGETEAMIDRSVNDEYLRLAEEEGFTPLPYGAEIDRFQHAPLSEVSSALLVGLALMVYVFARSPGISEGTFRVLEASTSSINALFTIDYLARWWCHGLRLNYLLNPIMIADLLSILPFLLRPWVPEFSELELTFLKLIRVQRIYRFFRPKAFKSILRILLGPDQAQPYEDGLQEVRPYQLQVLRTFGVVFTLLFITAALFYEAEQVVNPQFGDIFSSFYFSTIALSTVGFGDIAPMTPQGRLVITVAVIVGLCLIPSEASLVAAAISEEQRLQDEQEAEKALAEAERAEAQLAWDAARIAELEDQTREERARLVELEEQAKSWGQKDGTKSAMSSESR